ncbi:multiple epidermal growth factor-like domains protein 10 isoform X3 [Mytilus trossulus]|uniref:multiple epidermal growth factor-like domains protein 10 isoform X3 n=1 Tax=Mytilus trossulus TaxID=6551 RepID=UPI003006496E
MTKFKILFCLFVSLPFSRACEQCSFSSWHTWSKCSESCGGGIKTRQRSVCCPPEILYDTCLNSLCKDKVTYNDTQQTAVCNDHCLEGGTYNEGCSCRAGWTGRCCGIPCGDKIHGVNCSQGCECAEGLKCEKNSGQCVLRESVVKAKDCDDGYFGDGCNSTCNCQTDAICDKETGACPQEALLSGQSVSKEVISARLYIIIGSGIGVFFILQILIIILVVAYLKGRKRRRAEMDDRLDKEKFWSGKTELDAPENQYEEIPFDKKGRNDSKIAKKETAKSMKHKTSTKKSSIRKESVKVNGHKTMKLEDIYQGLAKNEDDCGYQALIDPNAMKYMAMKPAVVNLDNPGYMSMSDSPEKSSNTVIVDTKAAEYMSVIDDTTATEYMSMTDDTKAIEYLSMYNASGETCENKKKLYNFDVE